MRILTRYILKEVFSHSLLGLLVLTFVIFIPRVSHLLELVVRHGLAVSGILILFLLPIPGILILTIPMAVLVGVLLGLSRMAADGEVIAARALGIGLSQFAAPVLLLAFIGWGTTLWMSLFLAPQAGRSLNRMETRLRSSQAPYEIQPRVFIEQFPNLLLYVEDVSASRSQWRGVFIADTTHRDAPKVTLAESGLLVNDPATDTLTLHLEHGTTHEIDPQQPGRYSVVSFSDTDIPIPLDQSGGRPSERPTAAVSPLAELLAQASNPGDAAARLAARVELHYRLALPVASLVLALVGMSLGLFTRKGGKGMGLVLAILLVFLYYALMAFGLSFAKQNRIHPALGLWLANAVFGLAGILMMAHFRRVRLRMQFLADWFEGLRRRVEPKRSAQLLRRAPLHGAVAPRQHLFQILDGYVLRGWFFYFLILLLAFAGVYMVFDFFQLLGDIACNHVGARVILNYYRFLSPQVIYLMLPVSVLVSTLVTFGLLTKTQQMTALKALGISVYRAAAPVLVAAVLASAGMFALEDGYLPEMNQRQDALRNQIKGKPPQTYYRPDRQWIFGQSNRIFNYRFFDADQNVFANLSVFELDPKTFRMARRIYAARAFWESAIKGWVMEQGWVRELDGDQVRYTQFAVATFAELDEPPSYFKKEVKTSAQMSALELQRYISELRQSGFDVVRLSVQFYRKFSFPLMALVVALIGIPFSFTTGAKGALSGIALSIGIAIVYWSTVSLFEAMGNLSQLPPAVAAWSPDVLFGLGGVYLFLRVRT